MIPVHRLYSNAIDINRGEVQDSARRSHFGSTVSNVTNACFAMSSLKVLTFDEIVSDVNFRGCNATKASLKRSRSGMVLMSAAERSWSSRPRFH